MSNERNRTDIHGIFSKYIKKTIAIPNRMSNTSGNANVAYKKQFKNFSMDLCFLIKSSGRRKLKIKTTVIANDTDAQKTLRRMPSRF